MRQNVKLSKDTRPDKLTHKQELPKKKVIPERKKIRQLLRSMLPMEEEQDKSKRNKTCSDKPRPNDKMFSSKPNSSRILQVAQPPFWVQQRCISVYGNLFACYHKNEGAAELAPSGKQKRLM